jgi:hypothetical protein
LLLTKPLGTPPNSVASGCKFQNEFPVMESQAAVFSELDAFSAGFLLVPTDRPRQSRKCPRVSAFLQSGFPSFRRSVVPSFRRSVVPSFRGSGISAAPA